MVLKLRLILKASKMYCQMYRRDCGISCALTSVSKLHMTSLTKSALCGSKSCEVQNGIVRSKVGL